MSRGTPDDRKPRKPWTREHTDTLVECHELHWTDDRNAREIGFLRMTIWRHRRDLGLGRVDHPRKRDRLTMRMVRAETIRRARLARVAG